MKILQREPATFLDEETSQSIENNNLEPAKTSFLYAKTKWPHHGVLRTSLRPTEHQKVTIEKFFFKQALPDKQVLFC